MLSSPCLTCLKSDTWHSGPQWVRPLASQKTAWKFLKHPAGTCPGLGCSVLLQTHAEPLLGVLKQTNKAAAGLPDSCGHLEIKAEKSPSLMVPNLPCSDPSGLPALRTDGFPSSSHHMDCGTQQGIRSITVFRDVLPLATSSQGGIQTSEAAQKVEGSKVSMLPETTALLSQHRQACWRLWQGRGF